MHPRFVTMILMAGLLTAGWAARGQDEPADDARRDVDAALTADRDAQQTRSDWETERHTLRSRHDGLQTDVNRLQRRVAQARLRLDPLS